MKQVLVIGGGASGMAAAYAASLNGNTVTLIEKNEKLGKKIYITGKGRCNLTNTAGPPAMLKEVVSNPKFLYSAFYTLTSENVMELMEAHGCPVTVERGGRVFPVSGHASDVTKAWERMLLENGVRIALGKEVKSLVSEHGEVRGILLSDGTFIPGNAVIVCTGGLSYPSTGSTGDGYRFAKEAGHSVTALHPALTGLETAEEWTKELAGLTLKNIRVQISDEGKKLFEDFGEMLFTHYGVSGPLMLSASSYVTDVLDGGKQLLCTLDLKPALSREQLEKRILRDIGEDPRKQMNSLLRGLMPKSLVPAILSLSGLTAEMKAGSLTKEERNRLLSVLKAVPFRIKAVRGFPEAIITKGGVSVSEIDPKTMKSRILEGLYFAGEVLDVDALTGGYNLQTAWSTGYLAGISIR